MHVFLKVCCMHVFMPAFSVGHFRILHVKIQCLENMGEALLHACISACMYFCMHVFLFFSFIYL
jgi:hypothetical protein